MIKVCPDRKSGQASFARTCRLLDYKKSEVVIIVTLYAYVKMCSSRMYQD